MKNTGRSNRKENPFKLFILRLLLIEAFACEQEKDEIGMAWVEKVSDKLYHHWSEEE